MAPFLDNSEIKSSLTSDGHSVILHSSDFMFKFAVLAGACDIENLMSFPIEDCQHHIPRFNAGNNCLKGYDNKAH